MEPFNPLNVLSFDLETTSPDPKQARIVTSALVTINGRDVRAAETLADPGVEIPEGATAVHGISTEKARAEGRPHDEVLNETISAIYDAWDNGRTLIVFNAAYDLTVLRQLAPEFVVTGAVYDPYVIDRLKDPYRKGKRTLTDLCQEYQVRIDNAHEATSDALAAARIAWRQTKNFPDLTTMSGSDLMEYQTVGYYKAQLSFKKYLEGKGSDTSSVNFSWPMQG
ncbi:3'-5' exonuclease [Corynebacterium epidermidicanis]|uniref:DNA polymerase III epsilon subunit-like 3'-5' exonuclease n=1 Tax=Corynebacterium epidermidicanis TaxID=1050174 RepID=A0A0G3GQS6_9CORY|nr:3'-5' exonuclease [Corynebacterium epidermidicanis]AKK02925.1 DNA polymerase III epsilon subunit-like 3'-5' exonuclease [Corynebacterium epidermidicanis]